MRRISLAGTVACVLLSASMSSGVGNAEAADQCTLTIAAFMAKAAPKLFKSYEAEVDLTASVENVEGNWLRQLKPVEVSRRETRSHFVQTNVYALKGASFCEKPIQIRMTGTCITKATTTTGQRAGASTGISPFWLPGFNKPSLKKNHKVNIC